MQLDRAERIDKVEQAVGEQAGDYERLLRGMEKWERGGGGGDGAAGERRDRGKRKVVLEDDEDEEMEMGDQKRARSEVP